MSRFIPLLTIADALNMELKVSSKGEIKQSNKQRFNLGPWQFERVAYIESDYTTETGAALVVKLVGSLWLYAECVAATSHSPVQVYIIDAKKIGLTLSTVSQYLKGSHVKTTEAIRKGVVRVLKFDYAKLEWTDAQAADSVRDGQKQGAVNPGAVATNAS